MPYQKQTDQGFTLIELSIVLVIIGLIVGGVLVGRDLIKAAEVRAQISQLERFQTATNVFKLKTGYLPGDIPNADATLFGLGARGIYAGTGDGNGLLEGFTSSYGPGNNGGYYIAAGETVMFWQDLASQKLINDGAFTTATATTLTPTLSGSSIALYLPKSAIGKSLAYIAAESAVGKNYLGLLGVYNISNGSFTSDVAISSREAFSIDTKLDDGVARHGQCAGSSLRHHISLCMVQCHYHRHPCNDCYCRKLNNLF